MVQSNVSAEMNPGTQGASAAQEKGSTFLDALQNTMNEANQNQIDADRSVKDLIAGKTKNLHETMMQLQKADLSLKTMMQVRNKVLEAYKEVMKMQV
jgi:flagellar hook-basal body complex protein FliE